MTVEPTKQQNMRRVALTSLAGTSIEWYDFFLYGTAAAVIFPKAFFPQDLPPMVLLIISFSTFAVGFIARLWVVWCSATLGIRWVESARWSLR